MAGIADPEQVHPVYARAMRDDRLLDLVQVLLGGTVDDGYVTGSLFDLQSQMSVAPLT